MSADTMLAPTPAAYRLDPSDAERFAHYVPGPNAEAKVTEARVMGTPVTALCGKRWVPSRDPERFPLCPECRERAAARRAHPSAGGGR